MSHSNDTPYRQPGNDGTVYRCPICRKILPHSDVTTFPFCSDKCRLLDLGNWVDGNYKVSRPLDPTDHEDPDA